MIFLVVLWILFALGDSKLTPQENRKRLETCGKEGITSPTESPTWFWVSSRTLPNKETIFTSASQISSRHFLTFSSNILTRDKKWLHNGSSFDVDCRRKTSSDAPEVPAEVVRQLRLSPPACYRRPTCTHPILTPVKAYLPGYCDPYIHDNFQAAFSPMILEIQEDRQGAYICSTTEKFDAKPGDAVGFYGLYADMATWQDNVTIGYADDGLFGTTKIKYSEGFNGGPIIKMINGKWTIVGYISNYGTILNKKYQVFYRMSSFQEAICSATGICELVPTTTTTTTSKKPTTKSTTTTTTTTPKPTTRTTTTTTTTTTRRPTTTKPTTTTTTPKPTNRTRTTTTLKPTTRPTTTTTTTTTVVPSTTIIPVITITEPATTTTMVTTTKPATTVEKTTPPSPTTTEPEQTTLGTKPARTLVPVPEEPTTKIITVSGASLEDSTTRRLPQTSIPTLLRGTPPTTTNPGTLTEVPTDPNPVMTTEPDYDYSDYFEFKEEIRKKENRTFWEAKQVDEMGNGEKKGRGIELLVVILWILILSLVEE